MSDRPTSAHHHSPDEILAALEGSARILDADPVAQPTPAFRARGRAALLRATLGTRAPESRFLRYRLAGLGLAAFLFLAVAYPVVAGPGGVVEGVSTAASTVGHLIGLRAGEPEKAKQPKAQGKDAPTPTATPAVAAIVTLTPTATATGTVTASEQVTVADHPDNHGAAVSEIAHATPVADQNHGEQVREVARDNQGQSVSATAQAQAEERRDERQAPNPPAAKDSQGAQGRGQGQSEGRGREKATQNQGNAHRASSAAPTATPTMTPAPGPGVTIEPGPPADTKGGGSPKNGH